jgi:hypothetical protein
VGAPIVRLAADGAEYFCCPTTQMVGFGYVPGGLQGVAALEVKKEGARLVEVPVLACTHEGDSTVSQIELRADGGIRVRRSEYPRGATEVKWREWSKLKPEEVKQKFEKVVASVHPDARLLCHSVKNLDDLARPVVVEYEYEVEGYALCAGGQTLVFRVPELDYSASALQKYERKLPMYWRNRHLFENVATVVLPEGFRVRSMPAPVKSYEGSRKPFMWYEASFTAADGAVVFRDGFERASVWEPPERFGAFMQAIKESARVAREWIVVEKAD